MKVMGIIVPCQTPAQKPAGCASGPRNFDPGPATANLLAVKPLSFPLSAPADQEPNPGSSG